LRAMHLRFRRRALHIVIDLASKGLVCLYVVGDRVGCERDLICGWMYVVLCFLAC
jgi:hypothetical protein